MDLMRMKGSGCIYLFDGYLGFGEGDYLPKGFGDVVLKDGWVFHGVLSVWFVFVISHNSMIHPVVQTVNPFSNKFPKLESTSNKGVIAPEAP